MRRIVENAFGLLALSIQNISQATHGQTFYRWRVCTSMCIYTQFHNKQTPPQNSCIVHTRKAWLWKHWRWWTLDFENTDDGEHLILKTLTMANTWFWKHWRWRTLDFGNTDDGTLIQGERRREIQNGSGMVKLAKTPRNHGNDVKKIRNASLDYFMSNEGRVSVVKAM